MIEWFFPKRHYILLLLLWVSYASTISRCEDVATKHHLVDGVMSSKSGAWEARRPDSMPQRMSFLEWVTQGPISFGGGSVPPS